MPYIPPLTILAAAKAELALIPHPTLSGEKLFERVEFHENKKLREALSDLVIIKQRVAILVPSGVRYANAKEGRTIRSEQFFAFDVLLADRAWTKGGHEAVFGGANNVGVLKMHELVVDYFTTHAQLGLPYVVLEPQEGAQIELADPEVKDSPGRECFVLNYETHAGEKTIAPTAVWPSA